MTPASDPHPLPSPRGNESHTQGRSSGSWVRDAGENERHACGCRRIGRPTNSQDPHHSPDLPVQMSGQWRRRSYFPLTAAGPRGILTLFPSPGCWMKTL